MSYNHLQGQIPRASESITALGADLMGDKVNLFNGALEFEHTDAELPGNNTLRVAVTRRHTAGRHPTIQGAFGDWDLEAPRIGGVFTIKDGWLNSSRTTARCSQFSAPPYTSTTYSNSETVVTTYWYANEFWQGTHLHIPGAGSQEVLLRSAGSTAAPADGNSYPLVTREHWQLRCLPTLQNAAGEGFVAVSPDGTQYRFDWMATRSQPMLKGGESELGPIILGRREMMLMATLVTDRFGNTVRYTYSGSQLTRIEASDGRVITLTYGTNGLVSSVSDGGRTWSYSYAPQASPFTASSRLEQVNRPDGSRWQLALGGLVYPFPWELGEHANCDLPGAWPGGALTGSITHPSGAQGTFTTYYLDHSRSNVTKYCINKTGKPYDPKYAYWPRTLVSQSLVSKALSGPGLATQTWSYAYGGPVSTWAPCSPCNDTKTVSVTDPRGHVTRHTFGIRFRSNEGQLLRVDEGWNGTTAQRTTTRRYREPAGMPYPEPAGFSTLDTLDYLASRHRPLDQRVIQQDGVSFTWAVNSFDSFARATNVSRSSSLGASRTEQTAFNDHYGKWVIGQVASLTEASTGAVPESHTYDGATASLLSTRKFGRLDQSYAYYADGTLRTRTDGGGRTTTYSSYKRGLPQLTTYADGRSESMVVNDLGQVTSMTDANGFLHGFGYDTMGRLALVTRPTGDTVPWASTWLQFQQIAADEYGIAAGHWRQTITTGNALTVNYFDALWRPLLTRTYDAANEAGTRKMTLRNFDADGRKVYESYPQRSITSITSPPAGKRSTYDALGRVTQETQDSELGTLTTHTAYLNGFLKQVTNPRGYVTTTGFQAFDEPVETAITSIAAPEGVNVAIVRDVFGKPRSITRSGNWPAALRPRRALMSTTATTACARPSSRRPAPRSRTTTVRTTSPGAPAAWA